VQVGAFRARSAAEAYAARIRGPGVEPRVVTVEGSTLWRVRIGAYATNAEAAAAARALTARGIEAIPVSDARTEQR
jgi:cell division protein FtsN